MGSFVFGCTVEQNPKEKGLQKTFTNQEIAFTQGTLAVRKSFGEDVKNKCLIRRYSSASYPHDAKFFTCCAYFENDARSAF